VVFDKKRDAAVEAVRPSPSVLEKTRATSAVAPASLDSLQQLWQEKIVSDGFSDRELRSLAPASWISDREADMGEIIALPIAELRDSWQRGTPGISRRTLHQLVPKLFSAPGEENDFLPLPRHRLAAILGLPTEGGIVSPLSSLQRVREGTSLACPAVAAGAGMSESGLGNRPASTVAEAQMMLRALFHLDQSPTASELIEIIARQPAVAAAWMVHPRGVIVSQSGAAAPQWARLRESVLTWTQEVMRLSQTMGAAGEVTHTMSFGGRTLSLFALGSTALIVAQQEESLAPAVRDRFMLTARQLEPLLTRSHG
jgi:hypothetical protein